MINPTGGPLTPEDFASLGARWIDRKTAERQFLRRVNGIDGGAIVGRNGAANYAGLVIPYVWPGTDGIRDYRLRRDHPDIENGKPKAKYVAPPGRGNLLYFPVGTDPAWLVDTQLPLVITEGEFKAIALARAAGHGRNPHKPRFLAAALSGVWNWRGTIGKRTDATGNRVDEKGPIADLARLVWDERRVVIVFDADLEGNESVQTARFLLTRELRSRAALVSWFKWPADRPHAAKGIDDLLAVLGPAPVLQLINDAPAAGPPDLLKFHCADAGNAERLVVQRGADLRYCFAFKKWLIWNGQRWAIDDTGKAMRMAKDTIKAFLNQADEAKNEAAEKFARASLDSHRLKSMLLLAQSELPITPNELDRSPWLLNFTNGTVDLRSGLLLPHRRGDFITRMVGFAYKPEATCPRWLRFLDEIMGGGPDAGEGAADQAAELIDFIQRALGYSITGEVSAKALFVAYGSGDNGKTTLLGVVRELIREYAVTVGLDLLMSKETNNNIDAARAKLMGARLAVSSETEEGQRLSAARLKRICQGPGGEIEACRKYENPVAFPETHKLWIDANHKPDLPATDRAAWNRLHLIPFTVTIPKDRQDRQLTASLLKEAEGILPWLVTGAKRWYASGLPQSEIVKKATGAWREDLDRLAAYLEEHTRKASDAEAYLRNKVLYEAYKSWAEGNGEKVLRQKDFTAQMEGMGFRKEKKETGVIWYGIRFKS
jgi:putative DNA primase/helicase